MTGVNYERVQRAVDWLSKQSVKRGGPTIGIYADQPDRYTRYWIVSTNPHDTSINKYHESAFMGGRNALEAVQFASSVLERTRPNVESMTDSQLWESYHAAEKELKARGYPPNPAWRDTEKR